MLLIGRKQKRFKDAIYLKIVLKKRKKKIIKKVDKFRIANKL